jgi:hypothetical protein
MQHADTPTPSDLARAIETTTAGHHRVDTDCRCFLPWLARTVLSSSTSIGALTEAHIGDGCGLGDLAGTGTCPFHDIPSRSVNSVFTLAKGWRSSAHCACV